MSIDDIKEQLGSYDDWEPWRTVRYDLFELKEHIIHAALVMDGGLQNDEIEEEFENDTPWTDSEPLEMQADIHNSKSIVRSWFATLSSTRFGVPPCQACNRRA